MSQWKPTVCTKDCPDTCGLLAKVEGGVITSVKGDPDHPYTRGFICKKAGFYPEHVHSPKRITTPLKRIGPKGAGSFAPCTWEEALTLVTERMAGSAASFGPESILPYWYAGHMGMVQRNSGQPFFHKLGASRLMPTICGPAAAAGFNLSLGAGPSTDIESSVHSDFIVIWGNNTLTTNLHAWPFFQKARKNGARLVVIDPYRNATAKEADLHLMLRPGTDAALALAVMNLLIAGDMIDRDYIAEHTIGFEKLAPRASEYTPARAAEICGLAEEQIIELARGYGQAKAPYIRTGWGPARQLAGAMAMRTMALLPALAGAFKKKGGGITRSLGGGPADTTFLTRPDLCPKGTRLVNMVHLGEALTGLSSPPVKVFHCFLSNPAAVAPESAKVLAGLAREDLFTVVQEMFMTDTAKYADVILPGASFFEVSDLYKAYGHNYLQRARPVIPPVGESRPTLDIFQDLANRMGFTEEIFSQSADGIIETLLSQDSPPMQGIDMEKLQSGKAVRLNIPANPFETGFNTPSGKAEFYSKSMADMGRDPLPDGTPLRDPDGGERYPLEFITPPHRLFLNSAFNEIEALVEEAGPPTVMIHPQAAKARGINQGDAVRVFNGRGRASYRALVTKDTRPGLLVAEGLHWPSRFTGPGGANQLTSQRLADQGDTCAFHCNLVEVEPAL